jgi:hypothetical protein
MMALFFNIDNDSNNDGIVFQHSPVTLKIMALSFNRDSNDSDNHGIVVEHTIK